VKCLRSTGFHRLSSPSPDQLAILGYLQAQNGATKELIQHARDEGTQVYNRYLFENRRRALQNYSKHTSSNRSANRGYIHVEKTVAKSVSASMITDEMRSGYSPTQRSNDLIAGVTVARARFRWFWQGRRSQPAKVLYMNAQNCRMKYALVAWKSHLSPAAGESLKVVTRRFALLAIRPVIVPIIIVSRLCRPDRLTKGIESAWFNPTMEVANWSNTAVESTTVVSNTVATTLVGRLDSYLATELLLTVDLAVCCLMICEGIVVEIVLSTN